MQFCCKKRVLLRFDGSEIKLGYDGNTGFSCLRDSLCVVAGSDDQFAVIWCERD